MYSKCIHLMYSNLLICCPFGNVLNNYAICLVKCFKNNEEHLLVNTFNIL